ncbi:hypothetical protein MBLNU13_g07629t1 [Cladosporium sp. NU13]
MDMSSHTSVPVTIFNHAGMVFQFFALPRELRDMIYDHLRQDVEENTDRLTFNIRTIIPELRLVNRQFKTEYDERIAANDHKNTVTVTQRYERNPYEPSKEIPLPRLAALSTSLTVNIINHEHDCGYCHRCDHRRCEHSAHYRQWVQHWLLAECPLRSCRVELNIASRRCVPEAMANHRLITNCLERFGELGELNIYGPGSEKKNAGDRVPLAIHSGVSTCEKRAAMLKSANEMAESLGEWLWY